MRGLDLLFHRFPVIPGIAASLASVLDISSLEELSPNGRRDYHMASHFATDYRDSGGCKNLSPFIASTTSLYTWDTPLNWTTSARFAMMTRSNCCAKRGGIMKDISSSEASRERRRHSESPDIRRTSSKRQKYLKADSWSILFRTTPGPTANQLIIEKWRAGLPSI